jgi:hypothetical protein
MRTVSVALRAAVSALGLVCISITALAQTPQDVEPGVQTSSAALPTTGAAPAPAGSKAASAPSGPKAAVSPQAPSAPAAPAAAAGAPPKGGKSSDRLQLDTTQISGNRELPKVMYVVPWRKADPGEFTGRPLNSLLDEALTPVDRDVFRRQNRYYSALQGEPGAAKSQPGAAGEDSALPTPKDEK